jgi:hypothetical protein
MDSLLAVWNAIVQETEREQVQEGPKAGLVRNFLIDDFYYRESAFAAKIFATEYLRTKKYIYKERAIASLKALQEIIAQLNISEGVNEPMWTPRGVRFRKGSIPATILLLCSIEETARLLHYDFEYDLEGVLDFLELCYLGSGRFYHDRIDKNQKAHRLHVTNTSAMAYFFLQMAKQRDIKSEFYQQEIDKIERAILYSQRSDGFWPYIEPNILQRVFYRFSNFYPDILNKVYDLILKDRSIYFGDALHHVIILYFYVKGRGINPATLTQWEKIKISKGWAFVKSKLKTRPGNQICFDFSWEPRPRSFRYCNFIDASTYFYILNLLPYLRKLDIITQKEKEKISTGIINYIADNLLAIGTPAIRAYDGDDDALQYIIPRPSESVFDKGFYLADMVLEGVNREDIS